MTWVHVHRLALPCWHQLCQPGFCWVYHTECRQKEFSGQTWTSGLKICPLKYKLNKKPTIILEEKQELGQTLKGTVYVECNTARCRISQAVKVRQLKCWGIKLGCLRTKHICDFELSITKHFQKNKCLQCISKSNPLQNKFPCLSLHWPVISKLLTAKEKAKCNNSVAMNEYSHSVLITNNVRSAN